MFLYWLKAKIANITELTQGASLSGPRADEITSTLANMTDSGHGVFYFTEQMRNIYKKINKFHQRAR